MIVVCCGWIVLFRIVLTIKRNVSYNWGVLGLKSPWASTKNNTVARCMSQMPLALHGKEVLPLHTHHPQWSKLSWVLGFLHMFLGFRTGRQPLTAHLWHWLCMPLSCKAASASLQKWLKHKEQGSHVGLLRVFPPAVLICGPGLHYRTHPWWFLFERLSAVSRIPKFCVFSCFLAWSVLLLSPRYSSRYSSTLVQQQCSLGSLVRHPRTSQSSGPIRVLTPRVVCFVTSLLPLLTRYWP